MLVHLEGNCAYTNQASFVMGYKIRLPEIYTLSGEEIEAAQRQIADLIKRMPVNTFIQRFDAIYPFVFEGENLPDKTFLQASYKRHIGKRQGQRMDSYLFFSTAPFNTFFKGFRNPLDVSLKEAVNADNFINESFKGIVQQEINTINKSKVFACLPLEETDMRYFEFLYFNLFEEKYGNDVNMFLEHKYKDTDVGIKVGDNFVGGFSIFSENQLPNELPQIISDKLLQDQNKDFSIALGDMLGIYLQTPHFVSTIICRNDLKDWVDKIQATADNYLRMALRGPTDIFRKKGEEKLEIVKQIQGEYNETIIVQSNTNVFFWAESEQAFLQRKNDIASLFNEKGVTPKYLTGKHLRNAFLSTNPFYMCANTDKTMYPNILQVPVSFIPILGGYREDFEGCFFTDRFNLPIKVDLWDKNKKYINARNFIMIAPTGEGKSFLLMEYLRQMEEMGVVLVIIDLGKSFRRFAKLLGEKAAFIEYDDNATLGINPFFDTTENLLKAEKINSLVEFVYAHLDSRKEIQELDRIFLSAILKQYIEDAGDLSFPFFIHWVLNNESAIRSKYKEQLNYFDFAQMKLFLQEFIGQGRYAFLYGEQSQKSITDNLKNKSAVIFEIDKAQGDYKILSVLLQSIKDTIYANIWSDKNKRGIILFEEFAKVLKLEDGAILRQVEFYYQAIRKQEGSIGIVLQDISQIPVNNTSQSIFGNTHVLFALKHKPSDIGNLFDRLIKKDIEKNQLLSLKSSFDGKLKYSEVFIRRGEHSNIYRLEVSREQYLTYITDGQESKEMDRLIDSGKKVSEAVKQMIN